MMRTRSPGKVYAVGVRLGDVIIEMDVYAKLGFAASTELELSDDFVSMMSATVC